MAYDFPASPAENQEYTPAGGVTYVFKSPRWLVKPGATGASIGGSAPAGPATGQFWWNSTTKVLNVWDGSAWQKVDAVWAT